MITQLNRILLLGLCVGLAALWAISIRRAKSDSAVSDFGGVYYQARCVLEHQDAYDAQTVLRKFEADDHSFSGGPPKVVAASHLVITEAVYFPTGLLITAPFALLRWQVALAAWSCVVAGLLVIAAFAIWDIAGDAARFAGCVLCFMLLNCVLLLCGGNLVGVAVPLCVIAIWCFLEERFAFVGVAALALGLVVKPHDTGFIWLYFLLAGGTGRKRSLQTLALACGLGIGAAFWIAPTSPHWLNELSAHLRTAQSRGSTEDPGPSGVEARGFSPGVSLPGALSVFKDDPHFYNPLSYLIVGGLILAWCVTVLRKPPTREGTLLALAAISLLTLLPVYHLTTDAKLLMLVVPGCVMLWARKRRKGWAALALTLAAVLVTSDVSVILLSIFTAHISVSTLTLGGKLTLLALQPAPLVLLAAGCFYLWVYVRYDPEKGLGKETTAEKWLDAALAE